MRPYYERGGIVIYHGDCRDVLPSLTADVLVSDPPYGIRKAAWDSDFPTWWLDDAGRAARVGIAIMPGINNILRLPPRIGPFEYRWTLAIHLSNGMTRGLMGFGNWIPALVYARPTDSLYSTGQDSVRVPIIGDMPDHPSPKPLRAMTWLLSRLPKGSVLDPFMGSGTTLVAAKQQGRAGIGIEIEERYCEIAANRLAQEVMALEVSA